MRQDASPSPLSLSPLFANTLKSFAILIGDGSVLKMDLNYIVSHTRHKDVSKFAHSRKDREMARECKWREMPKENKENEN